MFCSMCRIFIFKFFCVQIVEQIKISFNIFLNLFSLWRIDYAMLQIFWYPNFFNFHDFLRLKLATQIGDVHIGIWCINYPFEKHVFPIIFKNALICTMSFFMDPTAKFLISIRILLFILFLLGICGVCVPNLLFF